MAAQLHSAADLTRLMPGVLEKMIEWLKMYKTTDGKVRLHACVLHVRAHACTRPPTAR